MIHDSLRFTLPSAFTEVVMVTHLRNLPNRVVEQCTDRIKINLVYVPKATINDRNQKTILSRVR